ncbi:hypothetical protein IT575_11790 [bacterium]|nr:hypothetical protein [bacterium]
MKKAKTIKASRKDREARQPFSQLLPSAAPPLLLRQAWPADAQWLAFWARQEQLMLEHGLLGPQAAEALGE